MDEYVQMVANFSNKGVVKLSEAEAWFDDKNKAKNAFRRLKGDGLAFPIARGTYAIPQRQDLIDILAIRNSSHRQAGWLQAWLERTRNRKLLPDGLAWEVSRFFNLGVDSYTELTWNGPVLLVPLVKGIEMIGRVYNAVPAFLYDEDEEPEIIRLGSHGVRIPSKGEVARILAVHLDPRLREAAAAIRLSESGRKRFRIISARTSPLSPFPRTKSRLKRGPPFRYRVFAPMSWVLRDHQFVRSAIEKSALT